MTDQINEAAVIAVPETQAMNSQVWGVPGNDRPRDEKGRPDHRYMTPDEKLDEILMTCRKAQDLADEHLSNLANNPQMLSMMKMLGRFMG